MIDAHNIRKTFGQLEVLKGIDLTVDRGEVVSIVGKSGAGKTTLLQILGTLERPDGSEKVKELKSERVFADQDLARTGAPSLLINNVDVLKLKDRELSDFRNRHIGFVFQFHHKFLSFHK